MRKKIIDVSEHQGLIDWEKVKPQIDGAIQRTGYGGDHPGQQDRYFSRNARACTTLGVPFGVYHYSYADTREKAEQEAEHILRLIGPYRLSYPVYLDVEEETPAARAFAPEACAIVGERITRAGYRFGVYANLYWWDHWLRGVDRFTKWVAQYNSECQYSGHDMWQYTDSGRVEGISGKVDQNYCYRDFPAELDETSGGSYRARVTAPAGLNVRKGPGTEFAIITALPQGTELTVLEERENWGRTENGWVCLDWLERQAAAGYPVQVTPAVGLNYRTGPGIGYPLRGAYPFGTKITITAEENGWGRTDTGVWVCLRYTRRM